MQVDINRFRLIDRSNIWLGSLKKKVWKGMKRWKV
jgi:hypothetical protein